MSKLFVGGWVDLASRPPLPSPSSAGEDAQGVQAGYSASEQVRGEVKAPVKGVGLQSSNHL